MHRKVSFEERGGVEAVAVARACATGSAGALGSGSFGDPGDVERLEAVCWVEAALGCVLVGAWRGMDGD